MGRRCGKTESKGKKVKPQPSPQKGLYVLPSGLLFFEPVSLSVLACSCLRWRDVPIVRLRLLWSHDRRAVRTLRVPESLSGANGQKRRNPQIGVIVCGSPPVFGLANLRHPFGLSELLKSPLAITLRTSGFHNRTRKASSLFFRSMRNTQTPPPQKQGRG